MGMREAGGRDAEMRQGKGSTAVAGFEDGGRGHQPRSVGDSRSWKVRKQILPGAPRRNQPGDTLIFAPETHVRLLTSRTAR